MQDLEVMNGTTGGIAHLGAAAQPSHAASFWKMTCERWLHTASKPGARYVPEFGPDFGAESCATETA
jgi:hypothetical protein